MGLEGGEVVVGPDGVVGRLMEGTMFVVDGTEGVVGALIVVVGLGNWLGGPAGRPATFSIFTIKGSLLEVHFYLIGLKRKEK